MACQKIAVHIGTHKTGTSAIQTSLEALKPELKAHGWHYLDGGPNHSFLYLLFTESPETEHDMIKRGLGSPALAACWVAETRARVARELRGVSSGNILISGEELCRLSPASAQRFVDFLRCVTPEICVVCFVRSPIGYCLSDAQEGIKGGLTLSEVTEHPPVAKYRFYLEKYVKALGAANVHVLEYQPPSPQRQSGLGRLAETIGLPPLFGQEAGRRNTNESLSLEAALILSQLNGRHPLYVDGATNPERGQLPMRWLRSLGSTPFSLPRATLARSLLAASDDVVWLQAFVGERWFASETISPDLPGDGLTADLTADLAFDIAGVLNDAALLVQQTMCALLMDRKASAERRGDIAAAAKLEANLQALELGRR
ncbi:hypothetical protein BH10PSE14_BH10PSE14_22160 [soil metagenome]